MNGMAWSIGFGLGILCLAGLAPATEGTPVTVGPRGELRVDGKPFFPIFTWNVPRSQIALNRGLGINAIVPGEKPSVEGSRKALFDELRANGMYALPDAGDLSPETIGHPAVLAWRFGDEPDMPQKGADGKYAPRIPPEPLIRRNREVRARDPSRPTWINLTSRFYGSYNDARALTPDQYRRYGEACDIISYDHYPITGWNQPGRIAELYHATRRMIELFPGKAHWVIVENADQNLSWTPPNTRGPTPQETRAMVWMSLVAGAKGIGYFPIAFRPFRWENLTPEMKVEMPRLNGELAELSPVLMLGEVIPATVSGDRIAVRALRHEGVQYLFAVNLTRNRVAETVTVPGGAGTLHNKDGGAPRAFTGGRVELTLEPLARTVLRSRPW